MELLEAALPVSKAQAEFGMEGRSAYRFAPDQYADGFDLRGRSGDRRRRPFEQTDGSGAGELARADVVPRCVYQP
jgi:hypothetical protein